MNEVLQRIEALNGNTPFLFPHPRIYELATDLRLYFGSGEKKDLEARLRDMIPLSEVATKLKEIEDSDRVHMAELEERKEAFVKLSAEV